jgi:hypothetical protein
MPLVRYFFYVGGVLLALLFISNLVLPKLPMADGTSAGTDKPVIRISSDRKWPERVEFDTSIPTITPMQPAKTEDAAPATVAQVSPARVREAFAQLEPSEQKKPEPKPLRKRKIAKKRVAPPTVLVAQQPRFGFFANNIW